MIKDNGSGPLVPGQMKVSFEETEKIAHLILETLSMNDIPVGYGMTGTILALARIAELGMQNKRISTVEEIRFIQDLNEWIGAYWGQGIGAALN